MSMGQIVGGVVGALLGVAGAPFLGVTMFQAAVVGFTLGSAIGSYIDPVTPDVKGLGKPQDTKVDITTCDEGLPVSDLIGTTRLTGNIVWYGNNRIVEKTSSSGGKGGGGGSSTVTGYEYYLSWAMIICEGTVDELYSIFLDDETAIWSGNLTRPPGGVETISIENFGTIRFYYGTPDQPVDSSMAALLDDSTLAPAYRNFCYMYFDDCYIGTYNRAPMIHVVIRKHPACLDQSVLLSTYDYNPAYMLYNILNNMVGLSANYLDSTSFLDEANRLYIEDFGLSLLLDRYQNAMVYMESILQHVDGIIYFHTDGKFYFKLLRADIEADEATTISEDVFLEPPTVTRKSWIDTYNEIKIQHSIRVWTDGTVVDPDSIALTIDGPTTFSCPGELQYTADGGVPPYDWSTTGDATVDGNGLVTVNSCGDFTVTVTDMDGNTASM